MAADALETIVSLAKRRGFIFPGSEQYGGLANTWDYGPLGTELKNNIKRLWWNRFVHGRDDIVGIDAALLMNPRVWEASGHLREFSDPLVECKKCHQRFRSDQIDLDAPCPSCGSVKQWSPPVQFNLMLKTFLGPAEEKANVVYFRPETAQAMFVDFKSVLETSRKRLPFGIAQVGKAFRNEITPGNFIFRTREFEQMEIEYFIHEGSWRESFEAWREEMHQWIALLGIDSSRVHEYEVPDGERAHYSKRTIDFEYDFPFGRKELYGLAYRTDFDLRNHFKESPPFRDPDTKEAFWPHVIEPTWGVDRTVLAVLSDAYHKEGERTVLKLKPWLAPYKVAVFPLLANKPALVERAREVYTLLRRTHYAAWDDRGNIGKRYYAQDEIGTPFCITVDFETLEQNDVTVRYRDTGLQERMPINKLVEFIDKALIQQI
jgi:glycyl-tRNA synthetase